MVSSAGFRITAHGKRFSTGPRARTFKRLGRRRQTPSRSVSPHFGPTHRVVRAGRSGLAGAQDQLGAAFGRQLVQDVRNMHLDGVDRELEFPGDGGVVEPGDDESVDALLAPSQLGQRRLLRLEGGDRRLTETAAQLLVRA